MVKLAHWTIGITAVGLALTPTLVSAQTGPTQASQSGSPPTKPPTPTNAPMPIGGANVLELMQTQVATVAGKARLCVVSIEDARALVVDFNVSPLRKTELEEQIAHLEIDKKAIGAAVTAAKALYQINTITLADSQMPLREQSRIDMRLAYLRQRLANFGREDALTQQKQEADEHIMELEGDLKYLNERVSFAQERAQAGVAPVGDLEETKRQQAHVQLDLSSARQQRDLLSHVNVNGADNRVLFRYSGQSGAAAPQSVAPKSGSGFCIGEGYIVTTADVVQGMNTPIVTVDDGRRIRASLVALDVERNIGLVRLTANANAPGLTLGDSDTVQPGHFAICIGNQTGQFNSIALSTVSGIRTQGVYSGTHFYPYLLQIDGAAGAGTSGAPVLNARGEVIGMIAAVLTSESPSAANFYNNVSYSGSPNANPALNIPQQGYVAVPGGAPGDGTNARTRGGDSAPSSFARRGAGENASGTPSVALAQGQRNSVRGQGAPERQTTLPPRPFTLSANSSFAIPVNELKVVVEELKAGKNIVHPWLGMALDDIDNAREVNGVISLNRQVRLRGLYADSPAFKAGAQPGDVLLRLNDKSVATSSDVRAAILSSKAGQQVMLIVQRAGKPVTLTITLETQPTLLPTLLANTATPAPIQRGEQSKGVPAPQK